MSLSKKVKVALDETRTLILGAQILLGFQLQGVFRPVFDRLPWHDRYLDIASLLFSSLTVGLLIAPSLHHQIVDEGDSTRRIHLTIGRFASLALAPFATAPPPRAWAGPPAGLWPPLPSRSPWTCSWLSGAGRACGAGSLPGSRSA